MQRSPVASSNVRSVGYDEDSQTLEVEFHGGSVYQYLGVTPSEYSALMQAASVGSYLHAHIKNKYPTEKITSS